MSPRYERTAPRQVPGTELMDALVEAAKRRKRPRDVPIFLLLRYTGMRRESVASLRARHLERDWGLRGVYTKGGKTRDIPLPSVVRSSWRRTSSARSRARSARSPLTRRSSGPGGQGRRGCAG